VVELVTADFQDKGRSGTLVMVSQAGVCGQKGRIFSGFCEVIAGNQRFSGAKTRLTYLFSDTWVAT
jgi:hypothetical protein